MIGDDHDNCDHWSLIVIEQKSEGYWIKVIGSLCSEP